MAIRNRQTASLWLCFGITGDFLGRGSIAFVIKSARPAQTVAANGDLSRLMNGNFFFSIFAGRYHLSLRCLSPTSPLGPLYITTLSRYMNPIRHCALAVVQTHTKREGKSNQTHLLFSVRTGRDRVTRASKSIWWKAARRDLFDFFPELKFHSVYGEFLYSMFTWGFYG